MIPMLGAAMSMTLMMLFRGSSLAAVGALMMVVTVVGSIVMLFSQRGKATRKRQQQREQYLEYLETTRAQLRSDEQTARNVARIGNPPPTALFDIVRNPERVWERRRGDEDFLDARLGLGSLPSRRVDVRAHSSPLQQRDRFMDAELELLRSRYQNSPGLPLLIPLDSVGPVSVVGDREFALAVCRNLLISAVAFQSPEDLQVGLAVPTDRFDDWEWATWLPHLADQERTHRTGPIRRIAPSLDELFDLMSGDLRSRSTMAAESRRNYLGSGTAERLSRILLFIDSMGDVPEPLRLPDRAATPADIALTGVYLVADRRWEPSDVAIRISQTPGGVRFEDLREDPFRPIVEDGELDALTLATARGLARELAPLRLSPDSLEHDAAMETLGFARMLGLGEITTAEIEHMWQPRSEVDFLRVPLGLDDRGKPVLLDLKESAQFGMGPHGLCVGATGSGKSELLRTLVSSLLVTHSPEQLSMVLVDYKGGATFAPFDDVPHVAGIITNLSDDVSLIERVNSSLAGEIQRRQEVLKSAGNMANITDYELHRAEQARHGVNLDPLPHLVVIIDEFGELLTARPDFIDLFLSIGRIGRSIGVHLLLSSQRIEGGKLRGLDTYLSYRLGLRTLSESESRTVLDTPDAFHLPPVPGFGYLKVDTTTYTRFKAGYVSGPMPEPEDEQSADDVPPEVLPLPRYAATLSDPEPGDEDGDTQQPSMASARTTGPTVMSTIVERLREFPRAAPPIWLPPLPRAIALDQVAGNATMTSAGVRLHTGGGLTVPIGLLDNPAKQWQAAWNLDLTHAGGNLVLIGGPQSGKSTALRTIIASLALTHGPAEVAVYGLDLLGSGLVPLEALPQVGGIASRTNREMVRRTIEEVAGMLDEREEIFMRHGIDSPATLRHLHAADKVPELASADVVLVVDGYGQLGDAYEDIEHLVHGVLARGSGYGVHVIATATRWNEVRMSQQSFFGNRIEFRLGDPGESSFGRKLAENIRTDRPGRALMDKKLMGHFALPRIDGEADADTATQGMRDMVTAITESATEAPARTVRVLPAAVTPGDVSSACVELAPGAVPLGLRESDLGVETLDLFGRDGSLVVLGDDACGKTNLLKHVASSLMAGQTADELVFAVFDPRRTLGAVIPDDYLGGYAPSSALAAQLSASVAKELAGRVPDSTTAGAVVETPLPRIVLLIDDYDVLTAGGNSPLQEFVPYLAMGGEIGLHVVLTRRVTGASRGMYESFFMGLRDSGASSMIMSGDRTEGPLINNVRASHLPAGRGRLVQASRPPKTVQTVLAESPVTAETDGNEGSGDR
ncbi:type VII secretion protein EccC [Spelaeicoccus albus]